MSKAAEVAEHVGGHGHEDHGHGGGGAASATGIGITMALLGVMLAFCAAMVGSERTELVKTLVEQANKWGIHQSETTKLRVVEGDLEVLKALTPSKQEAEKLDQILRAKSAAGGKGDDEDTAEIKDLVASSIDDVADLLAPDPEDITHFEKLIKRYQHDVKEAKEDAESYELAIRAHERAGEWYERAQLIAEIGVVIASVALLLRNRLAWAISVVALAGCVAVVARTAWVTHTAMAEADRQMEEAMKKEAFIEQEEQEPPPATPEADGGR
jgi:hypothetical protein